VIFCDGVRIKSDMAEMESVPDFEERTGSETSDGSWNEEKSEKGYMMMKRPSRTTELAIDLAR
jgi:hypothetical protein